MNLSEVRPILRWPLDISQHEKNAEKFVILRDNQEVALEAIVVPQFLIPILSRFDGTNSLADIIEEAKPYGYDEKTVVEFYKLLEKNLFLQTPASELRWSEIQAEFAALQIRPMSHVGKIYPESAAEAKKLVDGFEESAVDLSSLQKYNDVKPKQVVAVMSPHIDYPRGAHTYGVVSQLLAQIPVPDTIVLLGTSHQHMQSRFSFLKKGMRTPFGDLPLATDYLDLVAQEYGVERAFVDEIVHKNEHSLDLQLPLIGRHFLNKKAPKILPILVGSFHDFVENGQSPSSAEDVSAVVRGLSKIYELSRQKNEKILFVCGVDLAHVGKSFGDTQQYAPQLLPAVEAADRDFLRCLEEVDAKQLFDHICEDKDERKICGFPTLYVLLSMFQFLEFNVRGHALEYRQASDISSDCNVSFAAACWDK